MSNPKPKKRSSKPTEFQQGVLLAAASLMRSADEPLYAADILREFALQDVNCACLDEMDKQELRRICESESFPLRGLD
jgi:hypothetical protein